MNRYLIKVYSCCHEINKILSYKEFENEIEQYIDKQELYEELNGFYLTIYFLFKSNLNFFEKNKNTKFTKQYDKINKTIRSKPTQQLESQKLEKDKFEKELLEKEQLKKDLLNIIPKSQQKLILKGGSYQEQTKSFNNKIVGYYIFSNVIQPLKLLRYKLRSFISDIDDKEYILKELNKYNTVLKILMIQKQIIDLSTSLSEKMIEKNNEIFILNLSVININKINAEINYYKEEISNIKQTYSSIFTKEQAETQKELKEEAEFN